MTKSVIERSTVSGLLKTLLEGSLKYSFVTNYSGQVLDWGEGILTFFNDMKEGLQISDFLEVSSDLFEEIINSRVELNEVADLKQNLYCVSVDLLQRNQILFHLIPKRDNLNTENFDGNSVSLDQEDIQNDSEKPDTNLIETLSQHGIFTAKIDFQADLFLTTPSVIASFFGGSKSNSFEELVLSKLSEKHQSEFRENFQKLKKGKNQLSRNVLIRLGSGGYYEWVELSVTVSEWKKSKPASGFVFIRNIQEFMDIDYLEVKIQEDERYRISRIIHDNISQQLFGIRFMLSGIKKEIVDEDKKLKIDKIDAELLSIIHEARILVSHLGVVIYENGGLKGAFEKFLDSLHKIVDKSISVQWKGEEDVEDPKIGASFFRIFQEAIFNSILHSQSDDISVKVVSNDVLSMQISDNGIGFNSESSEIGFGLKNMRDHAESIGAVLIIDSEISEGTTVSLHYENVQLIESV